MTPSPIGSTNTEFRRVLGHFATGLTVLTSTSDEKPAGMTCQSFASVSLDPPLVAFFLDRNSSSWAAMRDAEVLCVNVLADNQEHVARTFATPGIDKFHDIAYERSPAGAPILPGVIAWMDCAIRDVFDAGDHQGVLAEVTDLAHVDDRMPLLFFRGGYGAFRP